MIERFGMIHTDHKMIADRKMSRVAGLSGQGQIAQPTTLDHLLKRNNLLLQFYPIMVLAQSDNSSATKEQDHYE